MPSARATIRIEWPSFKRLLICDCIRELILSVAMTGTSVAAGISARRFLLRWSSSDSTELTTSKRVVNFDPNAWSTHHQTGVVNLRSNWVVNFVAKGWSTSDPIGHYAPTVTQACEEGCLSGTAWNVLGGAPTLSNFSFLVLTDE
jgi:hypothetical protein